MTTTIRISASSHEILKAVSRASGRPMQAVLDEAIEHYRRMRFIGEVNAAYARVREDEREWGEVLEEREILESADADGLDDE